MDTAQLAFRLGHVLQDVKHAHRIGSPPPRQNAMNLEGFVAHDDLVHEGPEEPLTPVQRELVEPPQCEGE